MRHPVDIDLATDPKATRWCKRMQQVQVTFAREGGVLTTLEGPVHYRPGDALITGGVGDRWPVRRTTFDERYEPAPGTAAGADGAYNKRPLSVLARKMEQAFTVRLPDGQVLHGQAGDWLVQYEIGDQAVVANAIFCDTYHPG